MNAQARRGDTLKELRLALSQLNSCSSNPRAWDRLSQAFLWLWPGQQLQAWVRGNRLSDTRSAALEVADLAAKLIEADDASRRGRPSFVSAKARKALEAFKEAWNIA